MLLAKPISQTYMHAIFRFVSQDPRDRKYSKRLDVVDLKKSLPCLEGRNVSLTSAFIGRLRDNNEDLRA